MLHLQSIAEDERIETINEIVLYGSPDRLYAKIPFSNKGNERLSFKEIQLTHSKDNTYPLPDSIEARITLRPGKDKEVYLKAKFPALTTPGTYESEATIGGVARKVKFVVEQHQALEIQPSKVFLEEALPGKVYNKVFIVTNVGNIPAKVRSFRHSVMLDNDYICKSLSRAFTQKCKEGFMDVLDAVVKTIRSNMVKTVRVEIKEAGEIIVPGASKKIHTKFTLPEDIEHDCSYSGDLKLVGNKKISYYINT
jgi:hypothetical protein